MMRAPSSVPRLRQQSRRCELGRSAARCSCRCGGMYHGAPHPAQWVCEVARALGLAPTRAHDPRQLHFPGMWE